MWKVTLVLVASAVVNRAEPKSIRTGRLSSLMRMLGGLMSRWSTPTRCARSRPCGDRPEDVPQAALVEPPALLQHPRQRHAVLEIHDHVGGAVDLEQAADADDVGVPRRRRQVPQQLGFLDELLEAERVDFLGVGIDRDDRVLGIAVADRAREIFLDRDELVEIDSARLVDDAEAADAEHLLEAPFAQHRPGRQGLVAVRLVHRRSAPARPPLAKSEIAQTLPQLLVCPP